MLGQSWPALYDVGPTLTRYWFDVSCFLGQWHYGAAIYYQGGRVSFFREKNICSQSQHIKIVCSIKCVKKLFAHLCVRKKIDC